MNLLPDVDSIGSAIHVIRGLRAMLDADLARLYGVPTRRLNEQVRRNQARFPADFVFRLEPAEWTGQMWSQIATTSRGTKSEGYGGQLAAHEEAILEVLAEIRRLTQFPEAPRRGIGFTAPWPEGD